MRKAEKTDNSEILKSQKNAEIIAQQMMRNKYRAINTVIALILVGLLAINIYLATKPNTELQPVIVVNGATGQQTVINGAISTVETFKADEQLFLNIAKQFVINLRSVSTDTAINVERMREAHRYATEDAATTVNSYFSPYEKTNPQKRCKEERVEVSIYSSVKTHNDKQDYHYTIDWLETVYSAQSSLVKTEKYYRAEIVCRQYRPTEESKTENPLGLYIKYIYIAPVKDGFVLRDAETSK